MKVGFIGIGKFNKKDPRNFDTLSMLYPTPMEDYEECYLIGEGCFSNWAYEFATMQLEKEDPIPKCIFVTKEKEILSQSKQRRLEKKYDKIVDPYVSMPFPFISRQEQYVIDTCDYIIIYYDEMSVHVSDVLRYAEKMGKEVGDMFAMGNDYYYHDKFFSPRTICEELIKLYDKTIQKPRKFMTDMLCYLYFHKNLLVRKKYRVLYRSLFFTCEFDFVTENPRTHCTIKENQNAIRDSLKRSCKNLSEAGREPDVTREQLDNFLEFYLEYVKLAKIHRFLDLESPEKKEIVAALVGRLNYLRRIRKGDVSEKAPNER